MSPIDDELRAALRSRADGLDPAPDPLGGIERRARGMKRRRAAATVAGAALAVVAVAIAVPTVVGDDKASPRQYVTDAPTTAPSSGALDPAEPWAYRGLSTVDQVRPGAQSCWQSLHPGSTLTPLFGQRYEPAQAVEIAFVASGGPDGDRFGYWQSADTCGGFLVDEPLSAGTAALAFNLPGDEVRRLVVVTAPTSHVTSVTALTELAPGVVVTPLEKRVDFVVLDASGRQVHTGTADPGGTASEPANLLAWVARGNSALIDEQAVKAAFAHATGTEPELESVHYAPLYTGDTDSGVRFTIGQAWFSGDPKAHTFGYATGGTNGPQVFLGPETPQATELVALLVDSLPGTTTDLLVLVPRPGTGQLSYDKDGTGPFTPVASGRSDLNGVGLVDRSTTATDDRVEQLDGDGNLDRPIYRGPVAPFLCGDKECG